MTSNNCKLSFKQIVEYGEEDTITYDSARRCFVSSSPILDRRPSVEINLEDVPDIERLIGKLVEGLF